MAKSVEMAKARRRKAAEAQVAKEKAMWKKIRTPLFCVLGAIALILVGVLVFNSLYIPKNGVAVRNGAITGVGEDWIVANLGTNSKPSCYHLANVKTPEGFTLDPNYAVSGSVLYQARYFKADDETDVIGSIYVVGVGQKNAKTMIETLSNNSYFTVASESKTIPVNGRAVEYFIATTPVYDNDGKVREDVQSATLYAYTDSMKESSVGVCVIARDFAAGEMPAESVFVDVMKNVMSGLTIIE